MSHLSSAEVFIYKSPELMKSSKDAESFLVPILKELGAFGFKNFVGQHGGSMISLGPVKNFQVPIYLYFRIN